MGQTDLASPLSETIKTRASVRPIIRSPARYAAFRKVGLFQVLGERELGTDPTIRPSRISIARRRAPVNAYREDALHQDRLDGVASSSIPPTTD